VASASLLENWIEKPKADVVMFGLPGSLRSVAIDRATLHNVTMRAALNQSMAR
jgi:hypothetical protein